MSQINLTINIDDTSKFKDIIENELTAFSKEEIHEIVRDIIKKVLEEDECIRKLFLVERRTYYNSTNVYYEPSTLLETAAKSIKLDPVMDEISNKACEYLRENYKDILIKVITERMINSFIHGNSGLDSKIQQELILFMNNQNNR